MKRLIGCFIILLLTSPVLVGNDIDIEQFVRQSVVRIFYDYSYLDILGFKNNRTVMGSGVILDSWHVLTNRHLVSDVPIGEFRIHIFRDEKTLLRSASIEKFDFEQDLMLLKLNEAVEGYAVKLAEGVKFGEDMYFKGFSIIGLPSVRIGRVTTHPSLGIYVTPICNGDSGGGVFNSSGELIGVIYITYITKSNKDPLLCGYAIPLDEIRKFLK